MRFTNVQQLLAFLNLNYKIVFVNGEDLKKLSRAGNLQVIVCRTLGILPPLEVVMRRMYAPGSAADICSLEM